MTEAFSGLNEATDDPNIRLAMSWRNMCGDRFAGSAWNHVDYSMGRIEPSNYWN